jgi:cysteinyl-tRNA synthetase
VLKPLIRRAVVGLVLLVGLAIGSAWLLHASIDPVEETRAAAGERRGSLSRVRSWSLEPGSVDVALTASLATDLVVVDEALGRIRAPRSGEPAVDTLKVRPDGGRRLVLAQLSVGEAEERRPYWRAGWTTPVPRSLGGLPSFAATPAMARYEPAANVAPRLLSAPTAAAPAWLGPQSSETAGSYRVRYWAADWQRLLAGTRESAVDRILAAGFDGMLLDRAAIWADWLAERPTAREDMVALIQSLAAYARSRNPDFVVALQDAEDLALAPALKRSIDAIVRVGLRHGVDGDGRPAAPGLVASRLQTLAKARADGLQVLVAERLTGPAGTEAKRDLEAAGFVPTLLPIESAAPAPGRQH